MAAIASLRQQIQEALRRDDRDSLRSLLHTGERLGVDPFDATIARARMRVFAAPKSTSSVATQGDRIGAASASSEHRETSSADAVAVGGESTATGTTTATGHSGPAGLDPAYKGSRLIAEAGEAVASEFRSQQPSSTTAGGSMPSKTRIFGSVVGEDRDSRGSTTAASSRVGGVVPSSGSSSVLGRKHAPSVRALHEMARWRDLPDPWASFHHPWSGSPRGGDDTASRGADTASAASPPTVVSDSTVVAASHQARPRHSDDPIMAGRQAARGTALTSSASQHPTTFSSQTTTIHAPGLIATPAASSSHRDTITASDGRQRGAMVVPEQLRHALGSVVLAGMDVEGIVAAEGRGRVALETAQRLELAHEMERFTDDVRYFHQRTISEALVVTEDEEYIARQRHFTDGVRAADRLHRDFTIAIIGARQRDALREEEREGRSFITLQEGAYRRQFADATFLQLVSAVADWRRSRAVIDLERDAARLHTMADRRLPSMRSIPLMSSQPPSPHRSPIRGGGGGKLHGVPSLNDEWSP